MTDKDHMTVICGDALTELSKLPSESVQCCITSPPYWGLRDYGNGGQLGLEKTPEEYVAKMVQVFHEVRRVLKNNGTLWLNLGDSYQGGNRGGYDRNRASVNKNNGNTASDFHSAPNRLPLPGLKPKDLVGIPWLVAFALRADGWYLRSDIIWHKPNPMPESVTDRPTKSHEYLFLLTKNQRYYYDAEAIQEVAAEGSAERYEYGFGGKKTDALIAANKNGIGQRTRVSGKRSLHMSETPRNDGERWREVEGGVAARGLRNKRSVWTVTTNPYPDAHFATYPPDLIKPCILAGSRPGDTILDPFAGSGTTGMVAIELGRNPTLIELNPDYVMLIEQRCHITPGLPL